MFTKNLSKLSLATLSAFVIVAGVSAARADDSVSERAFQFEWFKYHLQITDGVLVGDAPTRNSVARYTQANDSKGKQELASGAQGKAAVTASESDRQIVAERVEVRG